MNFTDYMFSFEGRYPEKFRFCVLSADIILCPILDYRFGDCFLNDFDQNKSMFHQYMTALNRLNIPIHNLGLLNSDESITWGELPDSPINHITFGIAMAADLKLSLDGGAPAEVSEPRPMYARITYYTQAGTHESRIDLQTGKYLENDPELNTIPPEAEFLRLEQDVLVLLSKVRNALMLIRTDPAEPSAAIVGLANMQSQLAQLYEELRVKRRADIDIFMYKDSTSKIAAKIESILTCAN